MLLFCIFFSSWLPTYKNFLITFQNEENKAEVEENFGLSRTLLFLWPFFLLFSLIWLSISKLVATVYRHAFAGDYLYAYSYFDRVENIEKFVSIHKRQMLSFTQSPIQSAHYWPPFVGFSSPFFFAIFHSYSFLLTFIVKWAVLTMSAAYHKF